jgi:insertion element IS1 protein InsB
MKFTVMSGIKIYRWIWSCVSREAREYIDFVVGDRSTKTGLKLWNKIKSQSCGIVAADYWKSYNEMIPAEKLLQTKAETYTVRPLQDNI